MVDLFVNPVTLFLGALLVAGLLYLWGRFMAPPSQPGGYKQQMYTGGEAPKDQEIRPSYRFYHIALFFTILHVALLVLVTVPSGPAAWLALTYLGIISLAVAALVWRGA